MERKIFWIVFVLLGLIADIILPFWWALAATIPIAIASWWWRTGVSGSDLVSLSPVTFLWLPSSPFSSSNN